VISNQLATSLDLPKRTVALVLAGGRGSRLLNLTDRRAKPPFLSQESFVLSTSHSPTA